MPSMEAQADSKRTLFIFFALVAHVVDLFNETYVREARTLTVCYNLSYIALLCTVFSVFNQLTFCTCRSPLRSSLWSCLVVWCGDLPQAKNNLQHSKGPLDPSTLLVYRHGVAALAVTIIRIALLFTRSFFIQGEEQPKVSWFIHLIGLIVNLILILSFLNGYKL